MESYEEWDVTIPPLPPRSRLYPLEPIGIGTPYIESLTSYIARLAHEHHVSTKTLMEQEILPLHYQEIPDLKKRSRVKAFWINSGFTINGLGLSARRWAETLQALTTRDDLRFLTMLTWNEVIAHPRLLRRSKAWCPLCYEEWRQARQKIYDQLIWAINHIEICPRHQLPLLDQCQECREKLPFLAWDTWPGYCSQCGAWLGSPVTRQVTELKLDDQDELKRLYWITRVVGELIAAAPSLIAEPSRKQISTMIAFCSVKYSEGNVSALARLLKISSYRLHGYSEGNIPSFDILLQICYALSVSPLEFLTSNAIQAQRALGFAVSDLQTVSRDKGKPIMEDDIQHMRRSLEAVLTAEVIGPFPFIRKVAKQIGYHPYLLQKYCPDLYQELSRRYIRYWASDDARMQMRKTLEDNLSSNERKPLRAIARELGCDFGVLRHHFPDLCHAVVTRYQTRFCDEQIRQRLKDILANDEDAPSLQEVARMMGCKRQILMYKFPELCKQITTKYRAERRKRSEERIKRICTNVRQTILTLHHQGIYPSASRVTRLINAPSSIRNKEVYETWRATMRKLGYFSDN